MMSEPVPQIIKSQTVMSYDFARSVVRGLSRVPKRLDCRFLYDARGSWIFERICEQPEYYLTRTEAAILTKAAPDIAAQTGQVALIEFGSGSSSKTQIILEAYTKSFGTVHYTPVDISRSILDQAELEICAKNPAVKVDSFHGSYEAAFDLFNPLSPVMFLFLGSTIGNLDQSESALFWKQVSSNLARGDFCLLGIDITDDMDTLHAAYNDAAGFSAIFTKNIFERMNRELGASIDTDSIEHIARFNEKLQQIEIFGRFQKTQTIDIAPLDKTLRVNAGDMVLTEISRKFKLDQTVSYLKNFSLQVNQIYSADDNQFAVLLLVRE